MTVRASFDFETWKWVNPLACGFMWGEPRARERLMLLDRSKKNPKSLARTVLKYMQSRSDGVPEQERVTQWWGHNAGRFDGQLLFEAAVELGWIADAHVSAGRAVKMTFRHPDARRAIHVFDSMALAPASLEKCAKDFELESRKLFKKEDYAIDARRWPEEKLKAGCFADCALVLELVEKIESFAEQWDGQVRSTFSSTALSMVRAALEEKGHDFPRHNTEEMEAVNQWCRSAYFGGRVEVFHHRPLHLLTSWDVNSSYPWSMTQPVPWAYLGFTCSKRGLERMIDGERAGVIYAEVHVPESMKIPPLPFRPESTGGVYFPVGRWRGTFAACELAYARQLGCEVKPLEGQAYTVEQPFSEFVRNVYQRKQTSLGAARSFYKFVLNGSYGKFGQAPEREVLQLMPDRESADEYIARCPPGSVGVMGRNPRFLTRKTFRWAWQTHYALASYIVANSRILLHKGMLGSRGLAYVDTDGIKARTADVREGERLGEWKVEMRRFTGKFWAPKIYELHPRDGKAVYAAKGFPVRRAAVFRTLVRLEDIANERMRLLRSQMRKQGQTARITDVKHWAGRSRKRKPLPDGSTLPWHISELQAGIHADARSPLLGKRKRK